jgi:glutamyl-tRNA synthetase
MNTVVTRYAPSPTGFQHIGGIRTALFAYLYARKHNGTFILRIEDTDKSREVTGAIQHTIDALTWLGIEYDYGPDKPGPFGPCLQSDRLAVYRRYAEQLIEKGLAYPDPYTTAEVDAFRTQADAEKRPFLFRHHRPTETGEWDGTQPLRFKVPEIKRMQWHDEVRGDLSAGEEMLDDFILIKADGYPTYNFAHIVDDHEMGVTHVMRGEEFIPSTPKFLSLYEALGIPLPTFVTLPPIMGPDGKKKLSKRDGAKDLLEYRSDGYLPAAMCNFLALIGWNPGGEQELFPGDELVEKFSLERIQKSGGAFNEEKLKWMNKEYLARLTEPERQQYFIDALPDHTKALPQYSNERANKLTDTALERVHNQVEIREAARAGEYDWAFTTPAVPKELLKWKNDDSWEQSLPRLQKVAELLQNADFSSSEGVKAAVWPYAEEAGRGEVLWPLRVTLTGRERSPDPFTCAWVLGPEETLARIKTAIS